MIHEIFLLFVGWSKVLLHVCIYIYIYLLVQVKQLTAYIVKMKYVLKYEIFLSFYETKYTIILYYEETSE